jgi:hypothetical protein
MIVKNGVPPTSDDSVGPEDRVELKLDPATTSVWRNVRPGGKELATGCVSNCLRDVLHLAQDLALNRHAGPGVAEVAPGDIKRAWHALHPERRNHYAVAVRRFAQASGCGSWCGLLAVALKFSPTEAWGATVVGTVLALLAELWLNKHP